jgi:hypothetical protein
MKVKDTAMGKWFKQLEDDNAVSYIHHCLMTHNGNMNVFWSIIEYHDLKAKDGKEMAEKVFKYLMEFDMDNMEADHG